MSEEILEIVLRIGSAFAAGFILGVERESHGRAAGLRTLVLVSTGAATAALLSDAFYTSSFMAVRESGGWHPDPARLGAGVLTGIGFLGAGVILRHGNLVRGVTTASLIWLVTILGLCFGSGRFALGFAGLGVSVVTTMALPWLEDYIKPDWYGELSVVATLDGASVTEIAGVAHALGVKLKNLELRVNLVEKTRTVRCGLKYKKSHLTQLAEQAVQRLAALPGVIEVDWK